GHRPLHPPRVARRAPVPAALRLRGGLHLASTEPPSWKQRVLAAGLLALLADVSRPGAPLHVAVLATPAGRLPDAPALQLPLPRDSGRHRRVRWRDPVRARPGPAAGAAGGALRGGRPWGDRARRHPARALLAPLQGSAAGSAGIDLDLPPGAAVSEPSKELTAIPVGHYHRVMESGNPIRRAWHLLKFRRGLAAVPPGPRPSLLAIGCFPRHPPRPAPATRFSP